ncbi:MAG TPA: DUF456 domain-containing protein [Anaerolineae bacterium]|nr:DUF456 domain-containing protein [Anaerolineae bacterium]
MWDDPWLIFVLILMFIGLLGVVLPLVPGIVLVYLAALLYAFIEGFARIGPITLAVLTVLAVVGVTADLWVSSLGAKVGGASVWALLGGLVLGLVGLIFFSLPGAIVGSIVGVVAVEMWRARDWRKVIRSGGGWLIGWLLSTVVQLSIALIMIAIFLWQVGQG